MCVDQAGEGLSAIHCMKYALHMNIDEWYCMSHGVQNDCNLRDQACQVFNLKLVLLVVLNLPHGPEREEDMRFDQLVGCMNWYLDTFSAATSTLFQARAGRMYEELSMAGLLDTAAGLEPDEAVWQLLRSKWSSPRKGYRVKLCEFMRLNRCLKEVVQTWTVLLFEREVLGLEMDYFTGSDFKKRLGITEADAKDIGQVRATAGAQAVDARVLRSCGRNAVAVSAIVLACPMNHCIVVIMHAAAEPMCVCGRVRKARLVAAPRPPIHG